MFDIKNGTDTHKMRELKEIKTSLDNLENSVAYMASWDKTLKITQEIVLEMLGNLEGHHFVDYGSGKGKAILWSLKNDILKLEGKYLGIDFDPSLVEIAKNNARRMRFTPDVFINANVLKYRNYPIKEISFFYNPFDEKVLTPLLESLIHRSSAVIYVNPVHRKIFLEAGLKSRVRKNGWHANLSYEIFSK